MNKNSWVNLAASILRVKEKKVRKMCYSLRKVCGSEVNSSTREMEEQASPKDWCLPSGFVYQKIVDVIR
jgi:hypothetical protein